MPVFHTKTIESILEPVANQVKLYIRPSLRRHFSWTQSEISQSKFFIPMSKSENNFLVKNDSYNFKKSRKRKERKKYSRQEEEELVSVVAVREDKTLFLPSFLYSILHLSFFLWEAKQSLKKREITNVHTNTQACSQSMYLRSKKKLRKRLGKKFQTENFMKNERKKTFFKCYHINNNNVAFPETAKQSNFLNNSINLLSLAKKLE